MILSDQDIKQRLSAGDLGIHPLEDEALQLQPASVDLRLGDEFVVYDPAQVVCLGPKDPSTIERASKRVTIPRGEAIVLHPGQFALGCTVETVRIPRDLVAHIDGRSSVGRLAVVVPATAGFIDPGFEGQITLELSNIGAIPVKLYPGMRLAQLVLYRMTSPSHVAYGAARGSRYQGQVGPQPSRIAVESKQ